MKPKKGKKMSKYKKEIKHCESAISLFRCSRTARKLFAQAAKGTIWKKRSEETVTHRSIRLLGALMTESRKRLLSKMPQEGLRGTGTQALRKRAVTAASLLKLPKQNAFSLNHITWHYPSVARLAVKQEKKRGRRITDGSISNGLRSFRQR